MKQLLEKTLHQELINKANEFIEDMFLEKELKMHIIAYISHKFNQSLNFSQLTALHYDIFRAEPNQEEKIHLLTVVELILLSSDIMDDLQDGDSDAHPWGDVNLGQNLNIIMSILFICLEKLEDIQASDYSKKVMRTTIHQSILSSINGQSIDLTNRIRLESEYISMVSLKSGSLIKMACLLGAGEAEMETLRIIDNYSIHLGIIAQIKNDVHDMVNGFIKSDILYKKRTLPVLYYLKIQNPKFQKVRDYYLGNQVYTEMSKQEISALHETLIYGGAVEYCKVLEQLYLHRFKECINRLDLDIQAKEKLLKINI